MPGSVAVVKTFWLSFVCLFVLRFLFFNFRDAIVVILITAEKI